MDAIGAIKSGIDMSAMICLPYIEDLTDADLLRRPAPACNHINWQLGHLIVSENQGSTKLPGANAPALPPGFAEKYTKETSTLDDPAAFSNKAELLNLYKEQREATLAGLAKLTEADLDKPSGFEWAPTLGALLVVQGAHWLMHAGQWVVVRRQLGKPPLF